MDVYERIRMAPPKWISEKDMNPDTWAKTAFYCHYRKLEEIRFKVRLSTGTEYWSHFIDGQWNITRRNPRFLVTHWVAPFMIA